MKRLLLLVLFGAPLALAQGPYLFPQFAPYAPQSVAITGGTIDNVLLGAITPLGGLNLTGLTIASSQSAAIPSIQLGTTGSNMNWIGLSRGWVGYNSGNNNVELGATSGKNVILSVGGTGVIGSGTVNATLSTTSFQMPGISTNSNCSSSASPAVCAANNEGSVTVAASSTAVVVNTTAVTASSQIQITFDSSLGTKLSVTCNTTPILPTVSARVAGTSFTITMASAPATNPACLSYSIIN